MANKYQPDEDYNAETLLSAWWGKVKSNFSTIFSAFNNHISGDSDRHPAADIDYGGDTVAEALDNLSSSSSSAETEISDLATALSTETTNRETADTELSESISEAVQELNDALAEKVAFDNRDRSETTDDLRIAIIGADTYGGWLNVIFYGGATNAPSDLSDTSTKYLGVIKASRFSSDFAGNINVGADCTMAVRDENDNIKVYKGAVASGTNTVNWTLIGESVYDSDAGAYTHYHMNEDNGFSGGLSSRAGIGGAIGWAASADRGGAVGTDASTDTGGAVGEGANSGAGFAGGEIATADTGAAIGFNAKAEILDDTYGGGVAAGENSHVVGSGAAIGSGAEATNGGVALGRNASTESGASIGSEAESKNGFAGGYSAKSTGMGSASGATASTFHGGAVGYKANAVSGGAVGSEAQETENGGAVGRAAKTAAGGAVGSNAVSTYGGAVGDGAETDSGGAIGMDAYSNNGGAVGGEAVADYGGAVGSGAEAQNGFAGGNEAKCLDSTGSNRIDCIQLGTGTNGEENSLQIYSRKLMTGRGYIPAARSLETSSRYLDWKLGQSNATDTVNADCEVVRYEGKNALHITSRNVFYTLDETISSGKVTFSTDVYIPELGDESENVCRIYLENENSTWWQDSSNSLSSVIAEVININADEEIYGGPGLNPTTQIGSYVEIGWHTITVTIDYDNVGTDNFITLNVTDPNGDDIVSNYTMGSISGIDTSLSRVRLISRNNDTYFANMSGLSVEDRRIAALEERIAELE